MTHKDPVIKSVGKIPFFVLFFPQFIIVFAFGSEDMKKQGDRK